MTTPPAQTTPSPDGPLSALLAGGRMANGFDFFQAMHLLEEYVAQHPDALRASVRPHEGLGFPATDVRAVEVSEVSGDGPQALKLIVTFLGLYGVDSPLPSYFTTASDGGSDHETPALRDFLDIFNARTYALLYEALKKYRQPRYLECLAGLAAPAPDTATPVSPLLPFAGVIRAPVRNAEGLIRLVAARFPGVPVTVVENVPRWIPLQTRPRLGDGVDAMVLGGNALLGSHILDVSGRFRIVLGPVGWEQFERLRPRGSDAAALDDVVRLYAPDFLDYEVELRIKSTDLPETRLGGSTNRMGRTTWVGRPKETIVSEVVSYPRASRGG